MAVCDLCPFNCDIPLNETGKCKVRGNVDGAVKLLTYGKVTTMIEGPIEQKPLYHYHPGMKVLSIGGSGCNMFCGYCQNFEISQVGDADHKIISAMDVVNKAKELGCEGVAFTYSEPFVWYEYIRDVAVAARGAGLKTILKTNGYGHPQKFKELLDWMDAVNVDVKGSAKLYKHVAGIDLPEDIYQWVIMKNLHEAWSRCHTEVSTIAIPPYCDDEWQNFQLFSAMTRFTGRDLPLHILRFIPDFKMRDVPAPTMEQLDVVKNSAAYYFRYVYVDYAGVPAVTNCYACGLPLVERDGIKVVKNELVRGKKCPGCWAIQNFE